MPAVAPKVVNLDTLPPKQRADFLYFLSRVPDQQLQLHSAGGQQTMAVWTPPKEYLEELYSSESSEKCTEQQPAAATPETVAQRPSKPLNWILRIVEEVSTMRIKALLQEIEFSGKPYANNLFEYCSWAAQHSAPGEEGNHSDADFQDFSSFTFQFLSKKFGLEPLVKKMGKDLLQGVKYFRSNILEIEVFGMFVSTEKFQIIDQIFFLACWNLLLPHSQIHLDSIAINGATQQAQRRYLPVSLLNGLIRKVLKFSEASLQEQVRVQFTSWLKSSLRSSKQTAAGAGARRGSGSGAFAKRPDKAAPQKESVILMSNFVVFLLLNFKLWRREQQQSQYKIPPPVPVPVVAMVAPSKPEEVVHDSSAERVEVRMATPHIFTQSHATTSQLTQPQPIMRVASPPSSPVTRPTVVVPQQVAVTASPSAMSDRDTAREVDFGSDGGSPTSTRHQLSELAQRLPTPMPTSKSPTFDSRDLIDDAVNESPMTVHEEFVAQSEARQGKLQELLSSFPLSAERGPRQHHVVITDNESIVEQDLTAVPPQCARTTSPTELCPLPFEEMLLKSVTFDEEDDPSPHAQQLSPTSHQSPLAQLERD